MRCHALRKDDTNWYVASKAQYLGVRQTFRGQVVGTMNDFRAGNWLGKIFDDCSPIMIPEWDTELRLFATREGIPFTS